MILGIGMDIIEVATHEFARNGLSGARVGEHEGQGCEVPHALPYWARCACSARTGRRRTRAAHIDREPMALDSKATAAGSRDEDLRRLLGHCAKPNPHWRYLQERPAALVTFLGPHAYLSPSVYPDVARVPSWNYLAVHCTVRASLIEDPAAKDALLKELIAPTDDVPVRRALVIGHTNDPVHPLTDAGSLAEELPEALEEGDRLYEPVYLSEDAQEGPRAFAEKRAPRWQGR